MYLGIVAANTGMRENWARMKKRINSGELDPTSGDLNTWFASNVDETELLELKSFRESVLHSGVLVHANGSIDVYDKREGQQSYTLDQLESLSYTVAFSYMPMEVLMYMTSEKDSKATP